jgi:hypothetical protein
MVCKDRPGITAGLLRWGWKIWMTIRKAASVATASFTRVLFIAGLRRTAGGG